MTENKFDKEDLERFKEFEDNILNLNEEGAPKYEVDWDLEIQIKYDALIDHFGVNLVSEGFSSFGISKDDLSDQSTYLDIYGYLEAKQKQSK
jgi:hypothetical protein